MFRAEPTTATLNSHSNVPLAPHPKYPHLQQHPLPAVNRRGSYNSVCYGCLANLDRTGNRGINTASAGICRRLRTTQMCTRVPRWHSNTAVLGARSSPRADRNTSIQQTSLTRSEKSYHATDSKAQPDHRAKHPEGLQRIQNTSPHVFSCLLSNSREDTCRTVR